MDLSGSGAIGEGLRRAQRKLLSSMELEQFQSSDYAGAQRKSIRYNKMWRIDISWPRPTARAVTRRHGAVANLPGNAQVRTEPCERNWPTGATFAGGPKYELGVAHQKAQNTPAAPIPGTTAAKAYLSRDPEIVDRTAQGEQPPEH
jgi:hypothetical protein